MLNKKGFHQSKMLITIKIIFGLGMVVFPFLGFKNATGVDGKMHIILFLTIGYYLSCFLFMGFEKWIERNCIYSGHNDVVRV